MIKKIIKIFLITIFVFTLVYTPIEANALTLQDLYNSLKKLEAEDKATKNEIANTELDIEKTEEEINNSRNKITIAQQEIIKATEEITTLEKNIKDKELETKELVRYLQLSNGENAYLEYVFASETMTDLIYRVSVVDQLTKYNDELITSMNNSIIENKNKKEKLALEEENLKKLQTELDQKLQQLGKVKSNLYSLSRDIADEISNARAVIRTYEKSGCKLNDDIKTCGLLPPDTAFWRPMLTGYVTSEYGYRNSPIHGRREFHEGIDYGSSSRYQTKLYAVASGKVAKVFYDKYGGNQLVIHHYINGQYYSSSYAHMGSIFVKDGDIVTKETVVGMMGSTGSATGPHLHIAISTGRRYIDYISYDAYVARTINPRNLINTPSGYGSWYNRTTKY